MAAITFTEHGTIETSIEQTVNIQVKAMTDEEGEFTINYHINSIDCQFESSGGPTSVLKISKSSSQAGELLEYQTTFKIVGEIDESHFVQVHMILEQNGNMSSQSPTRPMTVNP